MERPVGNLQKQMNCRVKHWQRRRRENEANDDRGQRRPFH